MTEQKIVLHLVDGFGNTKKLIVPESASIPSIGHRINMGYVPYPKVTEVMWNYDAVIDGSAVTEVTVFMNDRNEQ